MSYMGIKGYAENPIFSLLLEYVPPLVALFFSFIWTAVTVMKHPSLSLIRKIEDVLTAKQIRPGHRRRQGKYRIFCITLYSIIHIGNIHQESR